MSAHTEIELPRLPQLDVPGSRSLAAARVCVDEERERERERERQAFLGLPRVKYSPSTPVTSTLITAK